MPDPNVFLLTRGQMHLAARLDGAWQRSSYDAGTAGKPIDGGPLAESWRQHSAIRREETVKELMARAGTSCTPS